MADELEPLHAAALAEVVKRLRESPAVNVLIGPEHVFGPDAASLTAADEWARCVLVRAGRNHGPAERSGIPEAARRDAVVEVRAEHAAALDMLTAAADGALHGAFGKRGDGFQHCVRQPDRMTGGGPGFVSIILVFALSCVPPAGAPTTSDSVAPARRVPTASPMRRPTP